MSVVFAPQYLGLRISAHRTVKLHRIAGQNGDIGRFLVEEWFHCGMERKLNWYHHQTKRHRINAKCMCYMRISRTSSSSSLSSSLPVRLSAVRPIVIWWRWHTWEHHTCHTKCMWQSVETWKWHVSTPVSPASDLCVPIYGSCVIRFAYALVQHSRSNIWLDIYLGRSIWRCYSRACQPYSAQCTDSFPRQEAEHRRLTDCHRPWCAFARAATVPAMMWCSLSPIQRPPMCRDVRANLKERCPVDLYTNENNKKHWGAIITNRLPKWRSFTVSDYPDNYLFPCEHWLGISFWWSALQ